MTRFSIMGDTENFNVPIGLAIQQIIDFVGTGPGQCKISSLLCWLEDGEIVEPGYALYKVCAPYGDIMEIKVVRDVQDTSRVFFSWPPPAKQIKIPKHLRASQDRLRHIRDMLTDGLKHHLASFEPVMIFPDYTQGVRA